MNTKTVTDSGKIMNAPSKPWNGERMKAMFQAANNSKLRYPLLIMTFLLLAAVAIAAQQLAEGILAEVQGVVYLFPL